MTCIAGSSALTADHWAIQSVARSSAPSPARSQFAQGGQPMAGAATPECRVQRPYTLDCIFSGLRTAEWRACTASSARRRRRLGDGPSMVGCRQWMTVGRRTGRVTVARPGNQWHAAVPDAPKFDKIEIYGSAPTDNADLARSGSSSRSAEPFAAAGPASRTFSRHCHGNRVWQADPRRARVAT